MTAEPTPSRTADHDAGTLPDAAAPAATSFGVKPPPGYEILGRLGRGGMGVVYKARQVALDRTVALKMILHPEHAGEGGRDRFRTEAEAVARLQHANVVQIHEVGEHDGAPYFCMEFCSGGSLAEKTKAAPLPPAEAARLVELLARAMHVAHSKGIVHRDLKPANVLLTDDGTPKVSDFGLARKLDEAGQTHSGAVMGTPSYVAPEQAAGKVKEVGPLADVYALGAILYECLAGRPPFKAATAHETLSQVMNDDPVPARRLNPRTPRDLETICSKCLRKEPAKRYASAAELADDLRRHLSGEPIRARPVGPLERAWKWARRNPAVASLLAVALLLALTAAAALSRSYHRAVTERDRALTELVVVRDEAESVRASSELTREQLRRLMLEPPGRGGGVPQGGARKARADDDPGGRDKPDQVEPGARGKGVTIFFTAKVGQVRDDHRLLDGSIKAGGMVTGCYTFDPGVRDSNDDPTVGDYRHRAGGYGILLRVGNYLFKTDPSDVDFLVEVVCRPGRHNYLLRSYNNLVFGPRLTEVCVDHVAWQLDDPRGKALTGDALPLDPPRLAAWDSDFGLTIDGGVSRRKEFFIRAHVTEVRKAR